MAKEQCDTDAEEDDANDIINKARLGIIDIFNDAIEEAFELGQKDKTNE